MFKTSIILSPIQRSELGQNSLLSPKMKREVSMPFFPIPHPLFSPECVSHGMAQPDPLHFHLSGLCRTCVNRFISGSAAPASSQSSSTKPCPVIKNTISRQRYIYLVSFIKQKKSNSIDPKQCSTVIVPSFCILHSTESFAKHYSRVGGDGKNVY